jgi:hypothetical protein
MKIKLIIVETKRLEIEVPIEAYPDFATIEQIEELELDNLKDVDYMNDATSLSLIVKVSKIKEK